VTTISIAEGTLHAMLAGCPALRSLVLHYNIGYRRLRINSETLRSGASASPTATETRRGGSKR